MRAERDILSLLLPEHDQSEGNSRAVRENDGERMQAVDRNVRNVDEEIWTVGISPTGVLRLEDDGGAGMLAGWVCIRGYGRCSVAEGDGGAGEGVRRGDASEGAVCKAQEGIRAEVLWKE